MSRTTRLNLSQWIQYVTQPWHIFDELIQLLEIGRLEVVGNVLPNGGLITIPVNHQMIVHDTYEVETGGELTIEGELVIL